MKPSTVYKVELSYEQILVIKEAFEKARELPEEREKQYGDLLAAGNDGFHEMLMDNFEAYLDSLTGGDEPDEQESEIKTI